MKIWMIIFIAVIAVTGCSNKQEEETNKQRQDKQKELYRTPPPNDRSKDEAF